jgi:DNA-binding HxlR family transcriptional regulator
MRWRDISKLDCTIARTLAVIGDRWTLLILRDAFLGTRRFQVFQASLGITRHRLADRLAKLVKNGVLRRERYQQRPPRYEYRLTDKGLDLYGVVVMIAGWGDKHMAPRGGAPVERIHRHCGQVTSLQLTCTHCGEAVGARDMHARWRDDGDLPRRSGREKQTQQSLDKEDNG